MAKPIVIDTDILIDFGLDRKDAVETMAVLEKNYLLTTTVITVMGLHSGCRSKRDIKKVEELIACFQEKRCPPIRNEPFFL